MRLLAAHVGKTVFTAILMVLFVVVALDSVGAIIDEAGDITRDYHFLDALWYVALKIPAAIHEYLPFSALIGCLVGVGALAGNSEVIVMRAAGVSLFRIVTFVIRPVLLFAVIGLTLGEYVTPVADQYAEARREFLRKGDTAQDSESGLWFKEGQTYTHFNAVYPNGVLFGVTHYKFNDDNQIEYAQFAERATFTEQGWIQENVVTTYFFDDRTEADSNITQIWQTDLNPKVLMVNVLSPELLSLSALRDFIQYLKQQGNDIARYELAFWGKTLQPLTMIALVLVAISFIFGPLRQSTMGLRIFVGVVMGVSFQIIQDMLGPSSLVFGFAPIWAVVAPAVVCCVIGFVLLRRAG